jgi:hypothetical protein
MRLVPIYAFLAAALGAGMGCAWSRFDFQIHILTGTGGGGRESLQAVDIDKDGDPDFFTGGGRGEASEWYENDPSGWKRHRVSDSDDTDVGAVSMDVDGDGWMDRVAGSFWYRNTGHPRDAEFTVCKDSAHAYVHDMLAADVDGDGRQDIINIDYDGIRWFSVPRDSACLPWTEHSVSGAPPGAPQHGGIAAGDVDGDGDMDISSMDRWYRNEDGKGLAWSEHANIEFGRNWESGWGISGKAILLDMDGDGALDLLESECDLPNGRISWFRNADGKGLRWEAHAIEDSTFEQDFHTLAVADYDGDGDMDVFSMGGPITMGTPLAFVWENLDGKGGSWDRVTVLEKKMGHEGQAVDMDGDGDMDILLKPWMTGDKFWLENLRIPPASIRPGIARQGPGAHAGIGSLRQPRYQPRYLSQGRRYDARGQDDGSPR